MHDDIMRRRPSIDGWPCGRIRSPSSFDSSVAGELLTGQAVYVVFDSAVSASAYTLEVECIKPKQ